VKLTAYPLVKVGDILWTYMGDPATLPPDDLLSTASFARDLKWWTVERSVRDTAERFAMLPPNDVAPQGPTKRSLCRSLSKWSFPVCARQAHDWIADESGTQHGASH